jgi:uncharacterized delta-60 repeat protein
MRGRITILIAAALALLALGGAATAAAAPPAATLDPSFGNGGQAFAPFPGSIPWSTNPPATAVAADGSLLLGIGETVERLDPDGHLDQAFGKDGEVKLSPPSGDSFEISGLAVDSQGRVVAVGTSSHDSEQRPPSSVYGFEAAELTPKAARIVRLLPDGSPDPAFGEGGVVETVFGLPAPPAEKGTPGLPKAEVTVTGVAIGADDGIVITGGSVTGRAYPCVDSLQSRLTYAAYVARLTASGAPDTGFGGGDGIFGGQNVAENPLHVGIATEPAIGPEGSITYASGYERCPSTKPRETPGLARLTAAGEWQPGFGKQDAIRGGFWKSVTAADGSIAAVNLTRWRESGPLTVLAFRAGTTGLPVPSFGKEGTSRVLLQGPSLRWSATVAVDGQGRVLLADAQTKGAWRGIALFRLRPDGKIERSFAPRGRLAVDVPDLYGPAHLLIDPQGRALLLGGVRGAQEGVAVSRLVFSR